MVVNLVSIYLNNCFGRADESAIGADMAQNRGIPCQKFHDKLCFKFNGHKLGYLLFRSVL